MNTTKSNHDTKAWRLIRRRILKRDRYRCRVFDCSVTGAKNLSVHHITPRDEGGKDEDSNLITLCHKHHDEIELACVRQVLLIESWDSTDQLSAGSRNVTRTILDTVGGSGEAKYAVLTRTRDNETVKPKRSNRRHRCDESTVITLVELQAETNLTELTRSLGYPPQFASTISGILHRKPGSISAEREDELRQRIGLPTLYAQKLPELNRNIPRISKPVPVAVVDRNPPNPKKKSRREKYDKADIETRQSRAIEFEKRVFRTDTTIGIKVDDTKKVDLLALITGMNKIDLLSDAIRFYLEAHQLNFVSCGEEDKAQLAILQRLISVSDGGFSWQSLLMFSEAMASEDLTPDDITPEFVATFANIAERWLNEKISDP